MLDKQQSAATTVDKMVLQCPIRSVVPVQAIAHMVASGQKYGRLDPVRETYKPIATGPKAAKSSGRTSDEGKA
jgi:hypothetical protein